MSELDIEFVKSLAREAGDRALAMIGDIRPEFKADQSLVTHIDRETEQSLRAKLAERYPLIGFQGEEYGRAATGSDGLWAVDPIDGTTNMVYGLPSWGVSIGLIANGSPAGGAFYMPRTREMFWAVRGHGAYCNDRRLKAVDRSALHVEDTLGFTSTAIRTLDLSGLTGRLRSLGSIAAEVCYTAGSQLCSHVGCFEGANDLAAALCIATEAGCEATYLTGEPLQINDMVRDGRTRAPFVVAPPQLAALIRSMVRPREGAAPPRAGETIPR